MSKTSLLTGTPVMDFKESFVYHMKILFPFKVENEQRRSLIRVYAMAWVSAMTTTGRQDLVKKWYDNFSQMGDPMWWPDSTWEWYIPSILKGAKL